MSTVPAQRRWNHEQFSGSVTAYLQHIKAHEVRPRAPDPNPDPSEAEIDIAWAGRSASGDGYLVPLLAGGLLRASSEHLRAVAALLSVPEVGLSVETLARACCESSARQLWLLEVDVPREERLARGYNYSLSGLPRGSAGEERMLDAVKREAESLGVTWASQRQGSYFGCKPPSRGELFRTYLEPVLGSAKAPRVLWQQWSQATHAGATAGFITLLGPRGDEPDMRGPFLVGAATAAAAAHMTAYHRECEYFGLLRDANFRASFDRALAGLALALLPESA